MNRDEVKEEIVRLIGEVHHEYSAAYDDTGLSEEGEAPQDILAEKILGFLDEIGYDNEGASWKAGVEFATKQATDNLDMEHL